MLKRNEELVLVAASGGLDSSITACILQLAGYKNIVLVHFDYNHRGGKAEKLAITNVCRELDMPLQVFDLSDLYKQLDTTSMLTDPNAKITTGTAEGLKRLDAWVHGRNMMFMTVMAIFAEAQVFEHEYNQVNLVGGWLNLSESGHYPDNSEAFTDSCLNMFKYGTLIGNRIDPLYCLSNLMKHELFVLIKHFGLEHVYRHTISCDRPVIETPTCDHTLINHVPENALETGVACNCMKGGIPACGSGLLSYWASKMVGMDDMKIRNFCEVQDPDYEAHIPGHLKDGFKKNPDINDIVNRILLPEDKLTNLRKILQDKESS